MQTVSQYALNVKGGAWTEIRCTLGATVRMTVAEDGGVNAGALQGIIYQLARNSGGDLTWGPSIQVAASVVGEPFTIAGNPEDHAPHKEPIGTGGSNPYPVAPGGPVTHGTIIFRATSATATPTTIDVTEND